MTNKKIKIGIQGGKGSTNEKACLWFAKKHKLKNYEIKYLISTENVLKALNKREIDYGTFAWKTSSSGLVKETQEAIKKFSFQKIDERDFHPNHALIYNSAIDKNKTINIFSHQQALKEHSKFLKNAFSNLKFFDEIDTAIAAKKLKNNEYPKNSLIIAPIECAKIYGLNVYLKSLPDNKNYLTKIYLISRK